ncbi:hypothetical protein L083_2537 [Actinoplanes sp. N902-109]|nr:hypothetical protein L083_2537 [Actinoplanes sp. N902-109]
MPARGAWGWAGGIPARERSQPKFRQCFPNQLYCQYSYRYLRRGPTDLYPQ